MPIPKMNASVISSMVCKFPPNLFSGLSCSMDELPIIRDNIRKGFFETQSKVNNWVNNLRKKIDGEEEDDFQGRPPPAASGYNADPPRQQSYGRRSGDYPRRSADHDRYDADPEVLGDDFTSLQLRDHEGTCA